MYSICELGRHMLVIGRPCTTFGCTETVLSGKISRATCTKNSKIEVLTAVTVTIVVFWYVTHVIL